MIFRQLAGLILICLSFCPLGLPVAYAITEIDQKQNDEIKRIKTEQNREKTTAKKIKKQNQEFNERLSKIEQGLNSSKTKENSSEKTHTPILTGFVDMEYKWLDNDKTLSGYQIYDGAFYIEKKVENYTLFVDLPFHWEGAKDIDGDGTNETFSNNFKFGQDKAQAFLTFEKQMITIQIGQFDTIYGYELNDSKDRFFADPGILFNAALPVTHTGFLAKGTFGFSSLTLLSANPNNQGSQGDLPVESGVQLGLTFGSVDILFGFLQKSDDSLTDLVIHWSHGGFDLGVEVDVNQTKDTSSAGTTSSGAMILIEQKLTDTLSLGTRLESLTKFPDDSAIQGTLGVAYTLSEPIRLKLDYTTNETKANAGDDAVKNQGANFSVVYKFEL